MPFFSTIWFFLLLLLGSSGWSHPFRHQGHHTDSIPELNDSAAAQKVYLWGLDLSGSMRGAGGVGGLVAVDSKVSPAISWCHQAKIPGGLNYDTFLIFKKNFVEGTRFLLDLTPQGQLNVVATGNDLLGKEVSGGERSVAAAGMGGAYLLRYAGKVFQVSEPILQKLAKARSADQIEAILAKGNVKVCAVKGIPERLSEFYKRLGSQGKAGTADEALERLRSTMDEVEDAMSGIPKKTPPPAPGMPDGRMYPPLDDFVTRNPDGSISAITKGHRIEISPNGCTRIINRRTGTVEFQN